MKNKIGKRGNWAKEHEFLQSNRVLCDNKTEDVKSLFVIFLFFSLLTSQKLLGLSCITPGIILQMHCTTWCILNALSKEEEVL